MEIELLVGSLEAKCEIITDMENKQDELIAEYVSFFCFN